ncbi:Hsp33 family molecular chaperone HslO [Aliiglaciecola sp. CAU 1673]|uniref:Hsp33 family molecular chaperone HslO n=1 Tax=Aliiglaciecola sp. CAU 1673 TaxID=3032595 RepID=UPI0023DA417C|nr:Hsp33 family molecular chaperone HslO [Aliiglaciecola sp. CAU 1673]MDF2179211.1 Hsp33 family molecular chaperone HslO [Aliiglaciecola sp. CAU 1673]
MTNAYDHLYRYLFSKAHVRGELVRLDASYKAILSAQQYPEPVQRLLGELMAATSLLTATLKFEGDIAVQLQSEGPVKYAVINGTHQQALRGVARWDGDVPEDFSQMFKKGLLAITITPKEGERYQGMVALDKPSLAECLEAYFAQSEQLATRVILRTQLAQGESKAAGMLLQILPMVESAKEEFEHLVQITDTISDDELFNLPVNDILYRLYHQEEVEMFTPQPVLFKCSCSKERSASALASVDKQDLLELVRQDGCVVLNCQYCHAEYKFDAIDIEAIHAGQFKEPRLHN